jgi:hypothetical protein
MRTAIGSPLAINYTSVANSVGNSYNAGELLSNATAGSLP